MVCAWALLCAGDAHAAPVALLDSPRASSVALAGSEVLVARPAGRAFRIDAVPVTGGPRRVVATIPGRTLPGAAYLAASAQQVAAIVEFTDEGGFPVERQLWIGPPAGPLRRVRGPWMPVAVDADGDRVLVVEAAVRALRFRARVLAPGAAPHVVPWGGRLLPPAALAGDRVAFVSGRSGRRRVVVADWRTGAVISETAGAVSELDLAPDGRVVVGSRASGLQVPRFAGDRVVGLSPERFESLRPVLAGDPFVPLGMPSSDVRSFAADATGAAWIANGCVLYAPVLGVPAVEPPAGPCPRAEAIVEEGDQTLYGRRVRFAAVCVAAPASGCRGTVRVRGERGGRVLGRGRFRAPMGARRSFEVVLSRRGLRHVRAGLRRESHAFLRVQVRVAGGRHAADGGSGAVIDREFPHRGPTR